MQFSPNLQFFFFGCLPLLLNTANFERDHGFSMLEPIMRQYCLGGRWVHWDFIISYSLSFLLFLLLTWGFRFEIWLLRDQEPKLDGKVCKLSYKGIFPDGLLILQIQWPYWIWCTCCSICYEGVRVCQKVWQRSLTLICVSGATIFAQLFTEKWCTDLDSWDTTTHWPPNKIGAIEAQENHNLCLETSAFFVQSSTGHIVALSSVAQWVVSRLYKISEHLHKYIFLFLKEWWPQRHKSMSDINIEMFDWFLIPWEI